MIGELGIELVVKVSALQLPVLELFSRSAVYVKSRESTKGLSDTAVRARDEVIVRIRSYCVSVLLNTKILNRVARFGKSHPCDWSDRKSIPFWGSWMSHRTLLMRKRVDVGP